MTRKTFIAISNDEWVPFGRGSGSSLTTADITLDTAAKCGVLTQRLGAAATGPFASHVSVSYGINTLGWELKTGLAPFALTPSG